LVLAFVLGTVFLPAAAFAQTADPCAKLLLFPAHDPALVLDPADRSFFTLHALCSTTLASEPEARESGIDLKLAYAAARVPLSAEDRFSELATWKRVHCAEYLAPENDGKLGSIVRAILAGQSPAVREEYERCRASRESPGCHAIPVGVDAVALLLTANAAPHAPETPAPPEPTETPEITEVRATGVLLPDAFDRSAAEGEPVPIDVESLAHLRIPPAGLLRLFARRIGAPAVSFDIQTTAGKCSVQTIAPSDRTSRVFSIRSAHTAWKETSIPSCYFKLGDDIWIDVANLHKAIETLARERRIAPGDAHVADLVPVIDGHPLAGLHPTNPASAPDPEPLSDGQPVHHLKFHLARNDANEAAWSRLLNEPLPFAHRVEVTLGFENGAALDTWLTKEGVEQEGYAFLIVVTPWKASVGGVLIGSALVLFLFLAGRTDIVRDTTALLRPDGRYPYSLAKAQMAFWFFIVISSYFVLWMITGDKDTITSSVVVLIGISAGTALGAAFMDASKSTGDDAAKLVGRDLPSDPREREVELARRQQAAAENLSRLAAEKAERLERGAPESPEDGAAHERTRAAVLDRLQVVKRQREFFSFSPTRRALYDLLGDNYLISFHRFQIFLWTLVLGVIFVSTVFHDLAMPEFSPTLLGIMGISGGTYLGFKLPEERTG
jgi:hypothetical protein